MAAMMAAATQRRPGVRISPPPPTSDEQKAINAARVQPKRNDTCPCGSGRKYKKCCLTKLREMEQEARRRQQRRLPSALPRERPMVPSAVVIEAAAKSTEAPADKNATAVARLNANVSQRIVWAYLETGLYITDVNRHAHPPENIEKWEAALKQFDEASEDERAILLAPALPDD